MAVNIPELDKPRVVIIGAGFAGLKLARNLSDKHFQVVLLDKNNFHQFQPLFYQVAMSGLEPSSIAFPIRKVFQRRKIFFRLVEVREIDPGNKRVITDLGHINYDHLVIACGATTNFFGNDDLRRKTLSLKSTSEALFIRNSILRDFERALSIRDYDERQPLVDIVIVGGGPTGVELAGAMAEMKHYILPKDYHEIDMREVDIHLVEGTNRLLAGMSQYSSEKAEKYLRDLGVDVILGKFVTEYNGVQVTMNDGKKLRANKVIWAAGIKANRIPGIPESSLGKGGRILVDNYSRVQGMNSVYAIGDIALMKTDAYPEGHPQVAQPAIQQGKTLAVNLKSMIRGKEIKPFKYSDKGTMATVGRKKAVVDLPFMKFSGFLAWIAWLWVHLYALIGTRNKIVVLINWFWNYITYDQALRVMIRPFLRKDQEDAYEHHI
jgi:NADH dehydrogenase